MITDNMIISAENSGEPTEFKLLHISLIHKKPGRPTVINEEI
jgi:hypothetical protein